MNGQQGVCERVHEAHEYEVVQPHRGSFAAQELRVCAAIQRTRYDVLCWHARHASCHWVNGAIALMYSHRVASDFSHPYTPIRWR